MAARTWGRPWPATSVATVTGPCPHQDDFDADECAVTVGVEMFTAVALTGAADR